MGGQCLFFVAAPSLGDKAIADPRLSLDVLLAGLGLKLLSQLADKDAQILRLVGRLRSPYSGKQGAVGHHLSRVAGQVKQQIEFLEESFEEEAK